MQLLEGLCEIVLSGDEEWLFKAFKEEEDELSNVVLSILAPIVVPYDVVVHIC